MSNPPADATEPTAPVPDRPLSFASLNKALDEVGSQFEQAAKNQFVSPILVANVAIVGSAGYVLWNLRSLYFLASLLTGTSLIRRFDPLAVLNAWEERKDEDESLQSMIDRLPHA
jgi:hypothetical protein